MGKEIGKLGKGWKRKEKPKKNMERGGEIRE